jgi:hypothetical protein
MPRIEFELKFSVFERAKTVHALDHAAAVISKPMLYTRIKQEVNMNVIRR